MPPDPNADHALAQAERCRLSAIRLIAGSRRHRERGDELAAQSALEESIREMVRCEVWKAAAPMPPTPDDEHAAFWISAGEET